MLSKCPDCNHTVSTDALSCPECGKPRPANGWPASVGLGQNKVEPKTVKRGGCLAKSFQSIFVIIIAVVAITYFADQQNNGNSNTSGVRPAKSSVNSVKTTILVNGNKIPATEVSHVKIAIIWAHSYQSVRILGQTTYAPSGSRFLVVDLAEENLQKSAITLSDSEIRLIDNKGNRYETSSNSIYLHHAFPVLGNLNPGVVKEMLTMFEVPDSVTSKNSYLRFQGGFSGDRVTLPL